GRVTRERRERAIVCAGQALWFSGVREPVSLDTGNLGCRPPGCWVLPVTLEIGSGRRKSEMNIGRLSDLSSSLHFLAELVNPQQRIEGMRRLDRIYESMTPAHNQQTAFLRSVRGNKPGSFLYFESAQFLLFTGL